MRMKLRYCDVDIKRGLWGGLKGINKRLREDGYKAGDEVPYWKIEKDPAVEYVRKFGHCEVYPLEKRNW